MYAGKIVSKTMLVKPHQKDKVSCEFLLFVISCFHFLPYKNSALCFNFILNVIFFYISWQMTQEISIHRTLGHKHIVGFESYFEDSDNVYVILELCRRRVSITVFCTSLAADFLQLSHLSSCDLKGLCLVGFGNIYSDVVFTEGAMMVNKKFDWKLSIFSRHCFLAMIFSQCFFNTNRYYHTAFIAEFNTCMNHTYYWE